MNAFASPASRQDAPSILWAHRKIPLAYGRHQCGRVAWTPQPQSIPVESQLESDWLTYLMHEGHLVAVHSQPFSLMYVEDGVPHRYTPDLLCVFDRLSRALLRLGFDYWTAVEVKPASRADTDVVRRRLQAVHDQLGLATLCLTERGLPERRH